MSLPLETKSELSNLELNGPVAAQAPQVPWASFAWMAGMLIACFYPMLDRLVAQWMNDDDMSHGFLVPLASLYIAWLLKDEILEGPHVRSYWGLAVMAWASIQYILGTIAAELFLMRTSIVFCLIGITLFVGGKPLAKKLAFPLGLLFFMVPIPTVIYTQITFPLQIFASQVAEQVLLLLSIPVLRDGNILELSEHKLSVVEACSGIRSLMSLTFLSLVYGYFFETRMVVRVFLLLSTVPIAIAANAFRVSMTGILYEYKSEWADGFFHTAEGFVIFAIALSLMLGMHRFIIWFYQGIQNARSKAQPETDS